MEKFLLFLHNCFWQLKHSKGALQKHRRFKLFEVQLMLLLRAVGGRYTVPSMGEVSTVGRGTGMWSSGGSLVEPVQQHFAVAEGLSIPSKLKQLRDGDLKT